MRWSSIESNPEAGALTAEPTEDQGAVTAEAQAHSAQERERAATTGRSFATGEETGIPGVPDLLALVALFISHPEDSTWWRSILTSYVNAHEEEVINHIKARNLTRGNRD